MGLIWLVYVNTLHSASRHFGAYSNNRYRAMLMYFGGDIFLSGSSGNVFGEVWKKGIMALSFLRTAGCRFGGEHLHIGSNHINSGTLNSSKNSSVLLHTPESLFDLFDLNSKPYGVNYLAHYSLCSMLHRVYLRALIRSSRIVHTVALLPTRRIYRGTAETLL